MNSQYRTPLILFFTVLIGGLLAVRACEWAYARWQLKLQGEALRQLHIMLEEHYIQHFHYPMAVNRYGKRIALSEGYTLGYAPADLIPRRRVSQRVLKKARETFYCTDSQRCWILVHPGPDRRVDIDLVAWVRDATGEMDNYLKIHPQGVLEYDPRMGWSAAETSFARGHRACSKAGRIQCAARPVG